MYSTEHCSLCKRIREIRINKNPYYVSELTTGYIVLGEYQFFLGYTLFICKKHINELHELPPEFRYQFLNDMSIAAEAVWKAFKPYKLNYELLGNSEPHLHWHIFPRYKDDPMPTRPIWCIDRAITMSESTKPSAEQLRVLREKLQNALQFLGAKTK